MAIILKVGIFVIRKRSGLTAELLLFTHVDHPEAPIQIPGGGIEPDEDPLLAAQRELEEESGLSGLPLIRYLGVSEADSPSVAKTLIRRHCYLFDGAGLPEHWVHTVAGTGVDLGLRFDYRWHAITPSFKLVNDLGYFLNPIAIPELYER
ncbi:RNA pyrophosphohydrolase [compost metagenome]